MGPLLKNLSKGHSQVAGKRGVVSSEGSTGEGSASEHLGFGSI